MNSGLTINQEKKIRADKITLVRIPQLEALAKCVQQYRRAQKITTVGGTDIRRALLEEIDKHLNALGL